MTLDRRTLTAAAVALTCTLGLTACGGSDSGSGSDSGDAGADGTRTVQTAHGEVEVPEEPKRVVVLDTAELDSALTLGVKPVGATRSDVASGFLTYLSDKQTAGIADVGKIAAPNLEKIAELEPDLILGSDVRDEERYDELSKIAPTVFTESTGLEWKENFELHAEALGKETEAEKVVTDYRSHADEVTEALGGQKAAKELETNVVRFVEGADTRIYGDGSYIATVLKDVGLGRPAIVEKATAYDGLMLEISPEQVDKADADVVFYTSYGDPAESGEAKAVDSGLWKDMQVTKDGNVFRVNDETWIQGIGYTAAETILDEIEQKLAK
ncbi:ABC transporter substrate-binding protein [Streptomyces sparsus]